MICRLQEFFENWAVAVEALATVALVIAASLQWGTMRAQARQERDRWKREDELRAEEKRPKAVFDFPHQVHGRNVHDRNAGCLELTCANLGSVNFLVVGMLITRLQEEPKRVSFSPEEYFVVRVGEKKQVDLGQLRNINTLESCGDVVAIGLILQGPSGEIETNSHRCRISYTSLARYIARDL